MRHADKVEFWPKAVELDPYRPLSDLGNRRAEALASRLAAAGIAAIYTTPTTRTLSTALPLSRRTGIPVKVEPSITRHAEIDRFLARLRDRHRTDRAVLVVAHAGDVREFLLRLGARPECHRRLGLVRSSEGRLKIRGYDSLWKIAMDEKGCSAIARSEVAP